MVYDNIKKFITDRSRKIILLWVLLFIGNMGFFSYYYHTNKQLKFMDMQLLHFVEMTNELTSVLYYHSQKNIVSKIDYEKTVIPQWISSYSAKFIELIPESTPEVDLLAKLSENFYAEKNLSDIKNIEENYQKITTHIMLLSRLTKKHIDGFSYQAVPLLFFLLNIGLFFVVLVFIILCFRNLTNDIMYKNNFILEDIWNELQDAELNKSVNSQQMFSGEQLPVKQYTQQIITHSQSLSQQSVDMKNDILVFTEQLQYYFDNITVESAPQEIAHNGTAVTNVQEVQTQIQLVQQLLSRLFTRSERASSLAKASSNNGFQAGILALNTSIEATKIGELGKNFIPISNKIKEFGEKSSQIGNAIVDELQDVNMSVRKAYTIGKKLLDISAVEYPITTPAPVVSQTQPIPFEVSTLTDLLERYNQIFPLIQQIQHISLELENISQSISTGIVYQTDYSLREILLRTFERLYRLNYGINPPDLEKTDN